MEENGIRLAKDGRALGAIRLTALEYSGERYPPSDTVQPDGTAAPEKSAVSVTSFPAKADRESAHATIPKMQTSLLLMLLPFVFSGSGRQFICGLLRTQLGEEIHLERVRELRRRAEGEVHVLVQHLRDVRPRDLHPPRELRLRDAKLLHPQQYPPQERRSYPVNRFHIFPAVIMDDSLQE